MRRSQDGSVSSSSSNKASGDEEVQKPRLRASDRPVWVDLVALQYRVLVFVYEKK
ncbi:hypothetical protein DPMN_087002 [Dreissena polymorpha]|uniref:Uncharacterized protein n=1 Tax=Dreissena polymorpha TaxID=45954 RepID=A0A9D4QWH4_DREPO|nr:hypothetical protein DPMN_087002 [Dreissena polymorpha]